MFLDAVEFGESSFDKGPEAFNPIDMNPTNRKVFRFVDAQVFVVADIDQPIIPPPAVGVHDTRRVHSSANHRLQRGAEQFGINSV